MSASGVVRSLEARTVGVFSPGVMRLVGLTDFLGAERLVFRPGRHRLGELDAVAGWGHKPTSWAARQFAARHGLPYLALEDGFLRSVGLGPREPPLSLVVDDLGIYYDARRRSRIEAWLSFAGDDDPLTDPRLIGRAVALRERIVSERLSKYNHAPRALPSRWRGEEPVILVVDQTYEDASVRQGLASSKTFGRMLEAARDEHPDARIVVKVHPATVAGHKRGYLAERALRGVEILAEAVNPVALLERTSHVYVCSSQLGFEALMAGKPVSCFGVPFYAGWGLTRDDRHVARRTRRRSLDELVAAALLLYPRYRHPVRRVRCQAEDVVDHLQLQRQTLEANARTYHCVGFTTWKRPFVRRYLASGAGPRAQQRIRFLRSTSQLEHERLDDSSTVVVWGQRASPPDLRRPSGAPVPVWRMEDGFLRSVGLGSQFTPPGSLVLDPSGIYYDPRHPSALERLLNEASFSDEELDRARHLREQIVNSRVSKYNVAGDEPLRIHARKGQRVVLVVGQVDDDASVRLGSPRLRSNLALLRAVRRMRPDDHVVYKPHPDVLSGNRRGVVDPNEQLWDALEVEASVAACLEAVDEVHTMTSLVGFEALLRGLPVVCHGLPFYAGWGLTDDRLPLDRRTRRLTIDQLVAATLLRYPRYYSWETKAFCTAEDMVLELSRSKTARPATGFGSPWLVRRLRDVAILSWEWLHA